MRDFDSLRQALIGPMLLALCDAPWAPVYVLISFIIHPALGLLVLVGGAVLSDATGGMGSLNDLRLGRSGLDARLRALVSQIERSARHAASALIPRLSDQNRCAQVRRPSDMIRHGWSVRRFQAKQH